MSQKNMLHSGQNGLLKLSISLTKNIVGHCFGACCGVIKAASAGEKRFTISARNSTFCRKIGVTLRTPHYFWSRPYVVKWHKMASCPMLGYFRSITSPSIHRMMSIPVWHIQWDIILSTYFTVQIFLITRGFNPDY